MARIITVTDDDSGVQAQVVVVRGDGGQEITQVQLCTTNGRGLRSSDLLILEELGLPMPASRVLVQAPPPEPEVQAAVEPQAPAVGPTVRQRRAGTARQRAARTRAERAASGSYNRAYRLSPGPEELVRLFVELGGPGKVAEHLGVPAHTVSGWRKRMTRRGVVFPTLRSAGSKARSAPPPAEEQDGGSTT